MRLSVISNLEDCTDRLVKTIKGASRLRFKFPSKNLHSQEGEYEYEQHQEDQESQDGGYRVDETLDQVTHGAPVSADTKNINIRVGRDDI